MKDIHLKQALLSFSLLIDTFTVGNKIPIKKIKSRTELSYRQLPQLSLAHHIKLSFPRTYVDFLALMVPVFSRFPSVFLD